MKFIKNNLIGYKRKQVHWTAPKKLDTFRAFYQEK